MGKLTVLKVRSLNTPGRYGDGDGLWLQVRDAEHKSWLFRYTLAGKARQMGLGEVDVIPLAEAREAARQARRQVHDGVDPIEQKRARRTAAKAEAAPTFRQVADLYIASHCGSWRNAKHRYQWTATLEAYAFPVLGAVRVSDIEIGLVMQVLEPIWHTKPETAARLRGRIEAILAYASARNWRTGENPARWIGHLKTLLPSISKVRKVEHHAALKWQKIGDFMVQLRAKTDCAALALEFVILTAARTGEVIGATWGEIDTAEAAWTIPGERMKAGKEHRVPLSQPALTLLARVAEEHSSNSRDPNAPIFPGGRKGKPLSNMAMLALLRRMGRDDLTAHGFRSTFRDWAAEATNFPRELAEKALAHVLKDKVEAAYQRGDLFEKRRKLMGQWATWCGRSGAEHAGNVVLIRGDEAA